MGLYSSHIRVSGFALFSHCFFFAPSPWCATYALLGRSPMSWCPCGVYTSTRMDELQSPLYIMHWLLHAENWGLFWVERSAAAA